MAKRYTENSSVEFKSYDGAYPNLCSGTLVLKIDGEDYVFPKYSMQSGGCVSFTADWDEVVEEGEWYVDIPEELEMLEEKILKVVNENVPFGCCGGCV